MYVRIARFEAAEGSEPLIEKIRQRMKEGAGAEMPVQRGLMLVDREKGAAQT